MNGALGQHAPQRREVVDQQRARQRLQRRALEVGLIHDRVLLLEVEHRLAHGRVVGAGLVLGEIERALAGQALLDLGEGRALGLDAPVRLDVLGVARVGLGERLQVSAPAFARAASSRSSRERCLPSSFCSVVAPQVGISSTASSVVVSKVGSQVRAASARKRARSTPSVGGMP